MKTLLKKPALLSAGYVGRHLDVLIARSTPFREK